MKFKKLHKNINFNSILIKAKVMNALGSTPNKIDDFITHVKDWKFEERLSKEFE